MTGLRATMWQMATTTGLTEGEALVLRLHPHWKTVLRPVLILAADHRRRPWPLIYLPSSPDKPPRPAGDRRPWPCVAAMLVHRGAAAALADDDLRADQPPAAAAARDPHPDAAATSRWPGSATSRSRTGVLDRILGCGRLVVESAGEHGQLVLTEIPQVEDVQAKLFQLVEDEQARPPAS